jgi:hypothetical protein
MFHPIKIDQSTIQRSIKYSSDTQRYIIYSFIMDYIDWTWNLNDKCIEYINYF